MPSRVHLRRRSEQYARAVSSRRYLIVNADDFGRSEGINRGVARAHEEGILTSASLMVRWPAAGQAADYARENAGLAVGLHFDLSAWTGGAVEAEFARQLDAFRRLIDADPTHLDSHHHVHRAEPVRGVLAAAAEELGVPLRGFTPDVRYCGEFYGRSEEGEPLPQAIGVDALIELLATLEAGITELGCHPGEAEALESSYRTEREQEVRTLCDPRVRAAVDGHRIELCSFGDVPAIRAEQN